MVRAKFRCSKKIETTCGFEVLMEPVTCGSKENEEFFNYTPYGSLVVGTVNAEAAKQLEVGKEYYIDISDAQ